MPRAANSSERLRLPHHRNPSFSRFLRRRGDDWQFDANGGSRVPVLLPENPPMMLLQDALTCAQSQAGESLLFVFGAVFGWAAGEAGVGDVDDGDAGFAFRSYGQSPATVLVHRMQRVADDLCADLEQLVGISPDE